MDRLACVEIPALPLQLLARRHPDWTAYPMAVVDRDQPQGLLLWVNERARAVGVLPGQRYAAALSLSYELRCAEVPPSEIAEAVAATTTVLRRFSPEIEPSPVEETPGIFWLNASGLLRLYPSLETWGKAVVAALKKTGLEARIAIGFHRFGVYATAKSQRPRVVVFADEEGERAAVQRTPLWRIGLAPHILAQLARLAVRTVGDFLALPAGGIRRRFGVEAHRLHQLGLGAWAPLLPQAAIEPTERVLELDDAESDFLHLTFLVKRELDPLIEQLAARGQAILQVTLTLYCEDFASREKKTLIETVKSSEPTLDSIQLLGLVRLRLESLQLGGGVTRLTVHVDGVPATREQLALLTQKPRRDLRAAARAVARLRAALGQAAVVRAELRPAHLPEARFAWSEYGPEIAPVLPLESSQSRSLIRRIWTKPQPLPARPAREPDGWLLEGIAAGPVVQSCGPHLISGGWWRTEVERDYYYAELRAGTMHWVYYDRRRRTWFSQGRVE